MNVVQCAQIAATEPQREQTKTFELDSRSQRTRFETQQLEETVAFCICQIVLHAKIYHTDKITKLTPVSVSCTCLLQ